MSLTLPLTSNVVDDPSVDNVRMHHFQSMKIEMQTLSNENRIWRKYSSQILLNICQGFCHIPKFFFRDSTVSGQVIRDFILRFYQTVVNSLRSESESFYSHN